MSVIPTAIAALATSLLSLFLYRLISNLLAAKSTGLPVLLYPIDPINPLWILCSAPLRPWLRRNLPKHIWNRLALTIYGWEFYEKRRPFDEYGDRLAGDRRSFVVASPGGIALWTADPVLVTDMLRRPGDFDVPALTGVFLGVFGANVLTSSGQRWARQRKIVASVINERISRTVFDSTTAQTEGMLEELLGREHAGSVETKALFDMVKTITIHVLSVAGMGATAPWRSTEEPEKPKSGLRTTYVEACKVIMENGTGAIVVPTRILMNWPSWAPGHRKMRQLGVGKREFPVHTKMMLDAERRRIAENSSEDEEGRANIMSHLIRASAEQGDVKGGLTEEELTGNLFLFTAAGFETTANTLSYAIVLLARYPEWQDWLFEEIDSLAQVATDAMPDHEYAAVFPRATRIMAVMLETLRLYTPTVRVIRTNPKAQELKTSTGTICLPAGSSIMISNIAVHLDPRVWRDNNHHSDPAFIRDVVEDDAASDEYRFRPSRWINGDNTGRALYQPPGGCFIPWGFGPRVCPGQKMSQVEFVAVMIKLLQWHRLEAVPLEGEDQRAVEKRLDQIMADTVPKLTIVMDVYDPEENGGLRMRLVRRK